MPSSSLALLLPVREKKGIAQELRQFLEGCQPDVRTLLLGTEKDWGEGFPIPLLSFP